MIQETATLKMLARRLYKEGQDGVLRLCIEPFEKAHYLETAHVAVGNIHMAGNQTLKQILWAGFGGLPFNKRLMSMSGNARTAKQMNHITCHLISSFYSTKVE